MILKELNSYTRLRELYGAFVRGRARIFELGSLALCVARFCGVLFNLAREFLVCLVKRFDFGAKGIKSFGQFGSLHCFDSGRVVECSCSAVGPNFQFQNFFDFKFRAG